MRTSGIVMSTELDSPQAGVSTPPSNDSTSMWFY